MNKDSIKKLIPSRIWSKVREKKIVRQHSRIAAICNDLIESFFANPSTEVSVKANKSLPQDSKIIWQYWAQGFDNLPKVVSECLASVDKYAGDYTVIRLCDANLQEYLDIPDYILNKKAVYGYTHFSDLLRLMLLNTYGGVWIDATIMLSGPIPNEYLDQDFFAFQRNINEERKEYWKNTYAYYFSWAKGFRVNMLSSFIIARKGSEVINTMCGCLLYWWKENDVLPDYFFFQILFDVLINGRLIGKNCPIVSDCPPHYLQQFRNDPSFFIKSVEEILKFSPIHKLTYK